MTEKKEPTSTDNAAQAEDVPPRVLSPAARRALAEAEERRRQRAAQVNNTPREVGGQEGPDPTRYGDWEKGGIASDF